MIQIRLNKRAVRLICAGMVVSFSLLAVLGLVNLLST